MNQKVLQPSNIEYEKKNGECTQRTILPLNIPNPNILAFDVSGVDDAQVSELKTEYERYEMYKAAFLKTMFNFEGWLDHVQSEIDPSILKYRSFDPNKISPVLTTDNE